MFAGRSLLCLPFCCKQDDDKKDEDEWLDFGKKKKKKKSKSKEKTSPSTQDEKKPKTASKWNRVRDHYDLPEKQNQVGVRWADLVDNIKNIEIDDDLADLDNSARDAELYASVNGGKPRRYSVGLLDIGSIASTSDSEDDSFDDMLANISASNDDDEGGKEGDTSNRKGGN